MAAEARCAKAAAGPNLLTDRPELAAAFPYSGHRLPEFLVRDVQVPLRLLDVGMPEHQLNRADVHTVGEQTAGAFMTLMPRAA